MDPGIRNKTTHLNLESKKSNGQKDSSLAKIAVPCQTPANGLRGESHAPELRDCMETATESCLGGKVVRV